jgi:hypothetical protein
MENPLRGGLTDVIERAFLIPQVREAEADEVGARKGLKSEEAKTDGGVKSSLELDQAIAQKSLDYYKYNQTLRVLGVLATAVGAAVMSLW